MKLFYSETYNSRKVCAAIRHLDAPVDFQRVDLARGAQRGSDFLLINPNGKIPALQDGSQTLWESNAIMAHLAVKAGSSFWPQSPAGQVETLRWLMWDANHFGRHAARIYFQRVARPSLLQQGTDLEEVEDALRYFKTFAAVLDGHLEGRSRIVGEHWTVADFAIGNPLAYAEELGLPLGQFSNLRRWYAGLSSLEAWQSPYPG